jgi:hypothetical protein
MGFLGRAAGAGAYGGSVGRSAVQNGIELGRLLYLGHGISVESASGGVLICEDAEEMRAKGFNPYWSDISTKPAAEDKSQLSIHCRVAAVALASKLATGAAAACFSNPAKNNQEFCVALWGGIRQAITDLNSELNFGLVEIYLCLGGGDTKAITPPFRDRMTFSECTLQRWRSALRARQLPFRDQGRWVLGRARLTSCRIQSKKFTKRP